MPQKPPDKLSGTLEKQTLENTEVVDTADPQNAQIPPTDDARNESLITLSGGSTELLCTASLESPQVVVASVEAEPNETPDSADLPNEFAEATSLEQALHALDTFARVGNTHFFIRLAVGKEHIVSGTYCADKARGIMPDLLNTNGIRKGSALMVRPLGASKTRKAMTAQERAADDAIVRPRSIGLDIDKGDTVSKLLRVMPLACYVAETSPGHFHVTVTLICDRKGYKDYRRRLILGVGADEKASGSYRLSGSTNVKKHRPDARVRLLYTNPHRIWKPEEIEASGVLAAPEPRPEPRPAQATYKGPRKPASYAIALRDAPRKIDDPTEPDYSSADQSLTNINRLRGFTRDEARVLLIEARSTIDDKAIDRPDYVESTLDLAYC